VCGAVLIRATPSGACGEGPACLRVSVGALPVPPWRGVCVVCKPSDLGPSPQLATEPTPEGVDANRGSFSEG